MCRLDVQQPLLAPQGAVLVSEQPFPHGCWELRALEHQTSLNVGAGVAEVDELYRELCFGRCFSSCCTFSCLEASVSSGASPLLCAHPRALVVPSFLCPAAVGAQAAIRFAKEPYSQDALHGRSAILRCEVEEPAHVEFEWLQNGLPIQDTEQRFKEGSNLQFAAVDRHRDAGSFQCVARNVQTGEEARTANASFNIKCECEARAWCSLRRARDWECPLV